MGMIILIWFDKVLMALICKWPAVEGDVLHPLVEGFGVIFNFTEPEIKKYCLERLANYKVPKQVMFVYSLPREADGKINKDKLR